MVPGERLTSVYDWLVPEEVGVGSPVTAVAEEKLEEVMGDVLYLMSYEAASLGALHTSVAEVRERLVAERLVIAEGGVVSGVAMVVKVWLSEVALFPAASLDFTRKWYVVPAERPESVTE